MIAYLRGLILHKSPEYMIVDVGGVGYQVYVSLNTFYELPDPGQEVNLYIYTHVREDSIQLYGFASKEEKATFIDLMTVSGVGPRMAIQILSGISPSELRRTVFDNDVKRLQKIPGVGKKTAERIILEMRHKLKRAGAETAGDRFPSAEPSIWSDALSALVNLGYKPAEAQKSLSQARERLGDEITLENLLREALRTMV
ncbi:MAG: Holliday junction branch migration protein RuvA [Deltaproteobacteria bacterium]|nr:Holliday junction branch migration protein RuvA [Deltaproteobacteria bacterium]MBW2068054.1 Holliday junction branch migration protein RuvA [Deltaproteobacteria bacterium]